MATQAELAAYRLMSVGRYADALPFARQAVANQSTCLPAHGMLATTLLRLGRRHEAEIVVLQALEYGGGSADAIEALAHVSMQLGQHERSNALYRRALELAPNDARFWYNFASSERSLGRLKSAAEACDRAIAADRNRYASYLLRSELQVQTPESNHVEELQAELARSDIAENGRMFLGYALAKEFDDLCRYDEAFRHLSEASAIRRRNLAYDVEVDVRKLARIQAVYSPDVIRRTSSARSSERYVFVIGLPRSGTTLLEHVLLGLPGISSNGETENFARALFAAPSVGGSDPFERAATADQDAVAENYCLYAGGDARDGAIIEKLPMNYLYAGAIRRALPECRIVLVSRHPLDSCFAMYRTLFGEAYPFSYDLGDLAKYFSAYSQLIGHWRECMGDTIHEVSYEDFVAQPEQIAAAVAAHCGLKWNAEALDVHKRSGVSFTASAAQIRRPIHRGSAGRWRRYHEHLEPLARALKVLGISTSD
jgi:tetratricopeptide (TPR) repeat protein